MNFEQVKAALLAAAADLIGREEELSKLDAYVGDGDHGVTIRKAFQQLTQDVEASNPQDFGSLFMTAAMAMMNTAGGAIGPILSSMFLGFSTKVMGKESLIVSDLADMFEGGMLSVQEMGGAKPGERTMLDALYPAVQALKNTASEDVGTALNEAAVAAAEGAKNTANMIAVRGRAKNLAERSLGYVDAGATSMSYFFRAFADSMKPEESAAESLPPMAFTYYVPTEIRFGAGACETLADAVKQYGDTALLLIGIPRNAAYEAVTAALRDGGVTWHEMDGVDPNPRITTVDAGAALCREKNVDVIIALGGGSTIDCAKGIAGAVFYDGPAWDLVLDRTKLQKALPLLTIPTMSAAGSEMGNAAVLTNPETNEKLLLWSNLIFPRVSFLDPTFVYTLPRRQTAAGTADIFIHTIEEYFDNSADAFLTDGICEAIMKTCVRYGKTAMDQPDNYEARANLMWAAPLAINSLIACGRRDAWTLHNTQHPLGGFYDVVHGEALAVLTPHWMRKILSEKTVDRFVQYGVNVFGLSKDGDPFAVANAAIAKTEEFFFDQLEIKRTLKELGVTDDTHFLTMATMAKKVMGKQYVNLTIEETAELYRQAWL